VDDIQAKSVPMSRDAADTSVRATSRKGLA